MEHYFKEDQPIVSMENKTVKVAWVDESSIITYRKEVTPTNAKPVNPFEYIFG